MQCPASGSCEAASTTHEVLVPPTIDISPLVNTDRHSAGEWDAAAEAVAKACEQWGFFQVLEIMNVQSTLPWSTAARIRVHSGHVGCCPPLRGADDNARDSACMWSVREAKSAQKSGSIHWILDHSMALRGCAQQQLQQVSLDPHLSAYPKATFLTARHSAAASIV